MTQLRAWLSAAFASRAASASSAAAWHRRALVALGVAVTLGGIGILQGSATTLAEPTVVLINSVDSAATDKDLDDGICDINPVPKGGSRVTEPVTGQPFCTMRAALQQLNSAKGYLGGGDIIIEVSQDWVNSQAVTPASCPTSTTAPQYLCDIELVDGTHVKNIKLNIAQAGSGQPGNLSYRMDTSAPYRAMPGRVSRLNPGGANAPSSGGPGGDVGSFFVVAPDAKSNINSVTIDLHYQLSWNGSTSDAVNNAVFFLNGKNLTLRGLYNIYGSESTIFVGPKAENVTITDGYIVTPNYYPERYLVVRGGAKNTTLANHTIQGFAANDTDWTWVTLAYTSGNFPVDGFTVDRVRFIAPGGTSGVCNGSAATSCGSSGIQMSYTTGQYVTGLRFSNNYMEYLNRVANNHAQMIDANNANFWWNTSETNKSELAECGSWDTGGSCVPGQSTILVADNLVESPLVRNASEPLLGFDNAVLNNLIVKDNTVKNLTANTTTATTAEFLSLPSTVNGAVKVSRNYLNHASGPGTNAIYWSGKNTATSNDGTPGAGNLVSSNAVITQNYFDWKIATTSNSVIKLTNTGLVDTSLNLYTSGSVSQTTPTTPATATTVGQLNANEENNTGGGLVTNALSANAKLNTWWPVAADPAKGCVVDLRIAPPSHVENTYDLAAGRYPTGNHFVDVYWTAQNDAEVFIGRYPVALTGPQADGSTGPAGIYPVTLQVPLPLPAPVGLDPATNASRMLSGYPLVPDWKGIGAPVYNAADKNPYGVGYPMVTPADTTADTPEARAFVRQVIQPAAGPVDAATGNISGYLRLQTVDPNANPGTPNNPGTPSNTGMPAVSQFSRTVPISGKCAPALKLNQATSQPDAASVRFLKYTLTSDMPLDPASIDNLIGSVPGSDQHPYQNPENSVAGVNLNRDFAQITAAEFENPASTPSTNADFVLRAVKTENTVAPPTELEKLDAAGNPQALGAKIVAITANPNAQIPNTEFTVVVSVDDSATVTLTLPAHTVTAASSFGGSQNAGAHACISLWPADPGCMDNASTNLAGAEFGLPNPQAATFTDNQITFINPLKVKPYLSAVVINQILPGAPGGKVVDEILLKSYTITTSSVPPSNGNQITFTASVEAGSAEFDTYQNGVKGPKNVKLDFGSQNTSGNFGGTMVKSAQVWEANQPGAPTLVMPMGQTASSPMWLRASCLGLGGAFKDDAECQTIGAATTIGHGQATSGDIYYHRLWVPSAEIRLFASNAAPHLDIAGYVLDRKVDWAPFITHVPAGAVAGQIYLVPAESNALTEKLLCAAGTDGCHGIVGDPEGQALINQITDAAKGWRQVCDTAGEPGFASASSVDCASAGIPMENGKPICFVYTATNIPPAVSNAAAWPSVLQNLDFYTGDGSLGTANPGSRKVSDVKQRVPAKVTIGGTEVDVSAMAEGYLFTVPALPKYGSVQVMSCGISHADGQLPADSLSDGQLPGGEQPGGELPDEAAEGVGG